MAMDMSALNEKITELVDVLRRDQSATVGLAELASASEVLISTMQRYFDTLDASLYKEFRSLAKYIDEAKDEIGKLRPKELKAERLPRAGQQLDAVVQATEEATQTIMDAAEEIMSADKDDAAAYNATVDDACMRIFEACSFQDITGQRITKVVETLTYIDERLADVERTWGNVAEEIKGSEIPEGDEALLNGPQLDGEGIDQTEVDALLDEEKEALVAESAGKSSQSDMRPLTA
jgi:chemotaxis protein CheZ